MRQQSTVSSAVVLRTDTLGPAWFGFSECGWAVDALAIARLQHSFADDLTDAAAVKRWSRAIRPGRPLGKLAQAAD
jgi:hypothetical protein